MAKFSAFFGLALALAIFTSCEKEEETPQTPEVTQQVCLLSKVLDQNNQPIIEITYNGKNQYISFIHHNSGDSLLFSYVNNTLSSIFHSYNKSVSVPFIRSYDINAQGFVERTTYTHPTSPGYVLYSPFKYNSANQLIEESLYAKQSSGLPDELRSKSWNIYDSKSNVEKRLAARNYPSPQDTVDSGIITEYDNKPNPFYPLRNFASTTIYWSKNNPVKSSYVAYDATGAVLYQIINGTWQYEYNQNGLIVKSTYIPTDGSAPTIQKYEYLCN